MGEVEHPKENNVAVQMNTNDLVSGDNVNELDELVVKSTSELRGIGAEIVDNAIYHLQNHKQMFFSLKS